MHQQTQNEDNRKPWKPSVLSIWTRDIAELPEVYPYELTQNIPSESVTPVDKFITQMLAYERPYPSRASEWLISEEEMFDDQGLYSNGISEEVDIDKLLEDLDNRMEDW